MPKVWPLSTKKTWRADADTPRRYTQHKTSSLVQNIPDKIKHSKLLIFFFFFSSSYKKRGVNLAWRTASIAQALALQGHQQVSWRGLNPFNSDRGNLFHTFWGHLRWRYSQTIQTFMCGGSHRKNVKSVHEHCCCGTRQENSQFSRRD